MSFQERMTVTIGEGGRIVLPASLRARLGLKPGAKAILTADENGLHIESQAAMIKRIQARVKELDKGSGSMVDELIAERRAEAARED